MMTRPFWNLLLVLGLVLISCQKKRNELDIKITNQKTGYGYQIIKNKKTLISQPYIPAIPGEQVFKDSLQARRTADLVIKKIGKSSFPRISVDELDSMKIEYEIQKLQ
ncbi:DUF4907 domain-containing protein [Epilithonimonas sp. JDS]|uniref:DUF4907 domain-containing protein n=1 Tax=Epilithonimonas sp. JDS TaxID=2902797 RepID=UPI001E3CD9A7|nr:DUF4907 domain-containing protein [Epilithonimonas sp. JDS]MCD9853874.1 DUF4907 domain-containing protein [Epilithonimonas sp. JDS]